MGPDEYGSIRGGGPPLCSTNSVTRGMIAGFEEDSNVGMPNIQKEGSWFAVKLGSIVNEQ